MFCMSFLADAKYALCHNGLIVIIGIVGMMYFWLYYQYYNYFICLDMFNIVA